MSVRMVSAARYVCDGCGAQAIAWVDQLPDGWVAVELAETEAVGLVAMVEILNRRQVHYCRNCREANNTGAPSPTDV